MMMTLPIGIDDFRNILESKLKFVDKSLLIKEVIDDVGTEVSVITRPWRLGKTLNLSMKLGIILELKAVKLPTKLQKGDPEELIDGLLEKEAEVALEQITNKQYAQTFESRDIHQSIAIGLAFAGKQFKVKYQI